MKQIIAGIIVAVLLVISLPALAQHREGHRGGHREGHWQGREIHRFAEHDQGVWRGGRWHHGRHAGRLGWWWVAAGTWYFYPTPVYPYPDPYTPSVTVINQQPPVVVAPQANAPDQPPAQLWYYCDSAKGYYPYVPSCLEAWRPVPAQPPQTTPH